MAFLTKLLEADVITVGSVVLGKRCSGLVVGESRTEFYVVEFAGQFEKGPLFLDTHVKAVRDLSLFHTPQKGMLDALMANYKAASVPLQQKSSDAYEALLSFIKGEPLKGTTKMATKTPQPAKKPEVKKMSAADTALKSIKEQAAKKEAAKVKPAAKAAAKQDDKGTPGRKSALGPDMKIKLLVKENPKRAGAAERFALYEDGMTVQEYLAAGGLMADVRWDTKMEFISVK